MKGYTLLKIVCQLLLPFVLLYGFYVILSGGFSPGGGFQGGLVFSSTYLMLYFIKDEKPMTFQTLLPLEKWAFFSLIVFAVALFILKGTDIQLPLPLTSILLPFFTGMMNLLIGVCVTFSLWSIMIIYTEEGDLK